MNPSVLPALLDHPIRRSILRYVPLRSGLVQHSYGILLWTHTEDLKWGMDGMDAQAWLPLIKQQGNIASLITIISWVMLVNLWSPALIILPRPQLTLCTCCRLPSK